MIQEEYNRKYFYKDRGTYFSRFILAPFEPGGPILDVNDEYAFKLSVEDLKDIRDLIDHYLAEMSKGVEQ